MSAPPTTTYAPPEPPPLPSGPPLAGPNQHTEFPDYEGDENYDRGRTMMGPTTWVEDGYVHRPETEDQIMRVQSTAENTALRQDHRFIGFGFLGYVMMLVFFQTSTQFKDFQADNPIWYGFFIFFATSTIIVVIMFLHGFFYGKRKKRIKKIINAMITGDDDLGIDDEDVAASLDRIYGK